ncbi:pseudouridine synthase [Syncephalis plumigaleata]|nr:pseudouridine synthase [Syncephalis plumigaleata]
MPHYSIYFRTPPSLIYTIRAFEFRTTLVFNSYYRGICGLPRNHTPRVNIQKAAMASPTTSITRETLAQWDKEQLIEYILTCNHNSTLSTETTSNTSDTTIPSKRPKLMGAQSSDDSLMNDAKSEQKLKRRTREARPFDMNKYAMRRIALKVAYFGWPYYGFAAQHVGGHGGLSNNNDNSDNNDMEEQQPATTATTKMATELLPTIEGRLIDALTSCRLITDPQNSRYTRCGRTDRGVSAAGQVIALDVRSALPFNSPGTLTKERKTIPSLSEMEEMERDALKELPYVDLLNRQLPEDIRVLAWTPVPDDFDARFHCRWRHYRYYFDGSGSLFVGERDFRNFCRIDASKPSLSFKRHVLSCDVLPLDTNDGTRSQFHVLDMKGTAFLWHQVRCMMAVLLLVGQGLESVDTVRALLDVTDEHQGRGRPGYDMASELPLVLHHCEFDTQIVKWRYATGLPQLLGYARLVDETSSTWHRLYTQWLVCDALQQELNRSIVLSIPSQIDVEACSWQQLQKIRDDIDKSRAFPDTSRSTVDQRLLKALHRADPQRPDVYQGGGDWIRGRRYTPLLTRPTCESYEVKRRKYVDRKANKL